MTNCVVSRFRRVCLKMWDRDNIDDNDDDDEEQRKIKHTNRQPILVSLYFVLLQLFLFRIRYIRFIVCLCCDKLFVFFFLLVVRCSLAICAMPCRGFSYVNMAACVSWSFHRFVCRNTCTGCYRRILYAFVRWQQQQQQSHTKKVK